MHLTFVDDTEIKASKDHIAQFRLYQEEKDNNSWTGQDRREEKGGWD